MTSFASSQLHLLLHLLLLAKVGDCISSSSSSSSSGSSSSSSSWCQHVPPITKLQNVTEEKFVQQLLSNYQKHHRPPNCNDGTKLLSTSPTIVHVNIFVNSISSVSVVDMDYSVDVFLRQRWRDSRLRFTGVNSVLSLNYMKERLWIPDLFFRNSKEGRLHTVTTPNQLLWVFPDNGSILFSQKLSVKLDCPMLLWNFPMDSQVCRVEMGSYGYSLSQLDFVWHPDQQIEINSKLQINEFEYPTLRHGTCVKAYNSTGKFACIYLEFHLVRKFGFYLIYTYLPSILVVMLSWVSFWIDYQAVPARISLGLLSILALITQAAAALQKLPRVSYIKAIDVWLFACLAFVVLSLLEFSLVNVLARRQHSSEFVGELRHAVQVELSSGRYCLANGRQQQRLQQQQQQQQQQQLEHEELDSPLLLPRRAANLVVADEDNGDVDDDDEEEDSAMGDFEGCKSPQLPRIAMSYGSRSLCSAGQQHDPKLAASLRLRRRRRRRKRRRSFETVRKAASPRRGLRAQMLDHISIFLFPFSFLLFNAMYWTYFLAISAHQNEGSFHE